MSLLNTPPVLSKNLSLSMIGNGIKGIGIMSSSISPQKKNEGIFLHKNACPSSHRHKGKKNQEV
jgi:hypothetical protein